MADPLHRLGWSHLIIFLAIYLALAALLARPTPGTDAATTTRAALFAWTGPFDGGIARAGQACCVQASWMIFPFSAALFAAGLAVQILVRPGTRWTRTCRRLAWAGGCLGWIGGAIPSLLHALN